MTTRRVVTTRRADDDIDNAVSHYLNEGAPDAALGLIDALADAKNLLSTHPLIGSTRYAIETGIPELRSLAIAKFPYIVFYTEETDSLLIVRILHARRDIPAELSDQ